MLIGKMVAGWSNAKSFDRRRWYLTILNNGEFSPRKLNKSSVFGGKSVGLGTVCVESGYENTFWRKKM